MGRLFLLNVKVAALTRFPQKGSPPEVIPEVRLLAGVGMEGNFLTGGNRQLCLLTKEQRNWLELPEAKKGLCTRRFKENLLLDCPPGKLLPPGGQLKIGQAVLKINPELKPCFAECQLYIHRADCRLLGSAVFAVVLRGGLVRVGDDACLDRPSEGR